MTRPDEAIRLVRGAERSSDFDDEVEQVVRWLDFLEATCKTCKHRATLVCSSCTRRRVIGDEDMYEEAKS